LGYGGSEKQVWVALRRQCRIAMGLAGFEPAIFAV
jgi:hypothetical protein